MNYVEKSLGTGEFIVYEGRLHWMIYVPGILLCLTVVGAVIGLPMLIYQFLRRRTTLFAVTNRRVVMRVGILSTNAIEMIISRIEAVDVTQTLLGRMLNYGTVMLIGTGGSREPFRFLTDPARFRSAVQDEAASV
ncbi:MAG TPA: PH domain-containing protein [Acetobacteraceae bacterium]|nr:PH domain-containing protein [Acetobacteraceae bacterium]HQU02758.1 PH domain-containing protein [Acetobacteraceae bacterium]